MIKKNTKSEFIHCLDYKSKEYGISDNFFQSISRLSKNGDSREFMIEKEKIADNLKNQLKQYCNTIVTKPNESRKASSHLNLIVPMGAITGIIFAAHLFYRNKKFQQKTIILFHLNQDYLT